MNCSKCQSLKISTIVQSGKEITRCWGCEFVVKKKVDCLDVKVKPRQKWAKKTKLRCLATNPPNSIDYWLWAHGTTAMSGADAMDAMQAEE